MYIYILILYYIIFYYIILYYSYIHVWDGSVGQKAARSRRSASAAPVESVEAGIPWMGS